MLHTIITFERFMFWRGNDARNSRQGKLGNDRHLNRSIKSGLWQKAGLERRERQFEFDRAAEASAEAS